MSPLLVLLMVAAQPAGPRPPAEAATLFEHHPEVRVELAACEPQVIDPIAARFDDRGRLWVVEMRDYPTGPEEGQPFRSRIRVLRDTTGDGRFDAAETFVDGLNFPTGLQPWKDGVIVTLAGQIVFFSDADGDGLCDHRETWFTGFAEENSQLRANHPTLGPDGLVYVAGGLRGGSIQAADPRWPQADPPVSIAGCDFAFDPRGGWFGPVTGNSQYGMSIDDFGRRRICSNRNPCREVLLPIETIRRDPFLTPADAVHDVLAAGPASRVSPLAAAWTTSNLHAGQFTAACGVLRYGSQTLPGMHGNIFVCEPTGYLVQRHVLTPEGATDRGSRGDAEREFLASRDPWFRPVDLLEGPNGDLYIVDMYRAVIEHPQWAPEELKTRPDTWWGNDRGRIWRVTAARAPEAAASPGGEVAGARDSAEAIAEGLTSRNAWDRAVASRRLVEAGPQQAAAVREVLGRREAPAAARARALLLLEAWGQLTPDDVRAALEAEAPSLRAVAAHRLSQFPELVSEALASAEDEDGRVRLAAALALGEQARGPSSVEALARLARSPSSDRWIRRAVQAVSDDQVVALLQRLTQEDGMPPSPQVAALVAHLVRRGTAGGEALAVARCLPTDPEFSERFSIAATFAQELRRRTAPLDRARQDWPPEVTERLEMLLQQAAAAANNPEERPATRVSAIRLLALANHPAEAYDIQRLLEEDHPPEVRGAAIEAFAIGKPSGGAEQLLDRLPKFSPELRRQAVGALLSTPAWASQLVQSIEEGAVSRAMLDLSQQRRLLQSSDAALRKRASQVLAAAGADRAAVIARYRDAMPESGDMQRGRAVFREHCASCHAIGALGTNVGPDISDSRVWSPAQLLTSILDPNAAIDAGFVRYTALSVDGRVIEGLLIDETAQAVTLQSSGGEKATLRREELETLQTQGVSLMPEGFEQQITPAQMRDLIGFIKNWRYLDGQVPGLGS